jgi:hypothetical protein
MFISVLEGWNSVNLNENAVSIRDICIQLLNACSELTSLILNGII